MHQIAHSALASAACTMLVTLLLCCFGCTRATESTPQVQKAEPLVEASEVEEQALQSTPTVFDALPQVENSIVIGLDADMTSASARSGEAIRRGVALAIDEINARGGVLGRPLELVVRDHRGIPARGVDNLEEFATFDRLVAVVGGIHTPVALQELEAIHQHKLIYLGAWAAGTPIVANDFRPNYVFRVSVRDEYAGGFLVNEAIKRGHRNPGLLLEQTGWGRSNEKAITDALSVHGSEPAAVEWFHWGTQDLDDELARISKAGADSLILVCNTLEGVAAVRSMARLAPEERLAIISHWGISAGNFFTLAEYHLKKTDIVFLQTYSFIKPPLPKRAKSFVKKYCQRFNDCVDAREIFSPVGTAQAYDIVHMLGMAIEATGMADRSKIRDALEEIDEYSGLIRDYRPPFTAERHDALDASDFCLARYARDGAIVPITD